MKKRMRIAIPIGILLILAAIGAVLYTELYYLQGDVSLAYGLTVASEKIHLSSREQADLKADLEVINERNVRRSERKMREGSYTYEVADPSVLSVSENGVVSPKKVGTTTVTVRFAELVKTVEIEVYIPIDSIALSEHQFSLHVGETAKVTAVIEPANATLYEKTYYYTSGEEIASVSEDGTITALSPGTVLIRLESNGFTDMALVYVDAPLKGIALNETELGLIKGEEFSFAVAYDPENTTDSKTVTYSVSDEKVGTVSAEGLFTALAGGQTVVTAKVGRFTAECAIDVRVPLEGIRFTSSALTIRAGDSVTLPVAFDPADTTDDKTLTWTSSDSGVVSVDENGKIRALNAGKATIKASCGEFTTSMTVTVIIPINGVTISASSLVLDKGTTGKLSASVLPVNTTEERYIDWASDNARVATVDGSGNVHAVGPGQATITAYHDDFRASCVVTVLSHIEKIEFEQTDIALIESFSAPLGVIFTPIDTTDDRTVSFWSEDTGVAVIEGNTVRAVSAGTTTIIATVGSHTATAEVVVSPFVEVEEILVDPGSIIFEEIGNTKKLAVTVLPEDATISAVSYSSSDSYVATVSSDGTVTATGSGDCVITAHAGGKTVDIPVHVNAENIVVVLDPGHGSNHGGAEWTVNGTRIYEQVINLRVAQVAKEYLMAHYGGVTVHLTHENLSCFGGPLGDCLRQRCEFAQQKNAAFLVSCHFNMSSSHAASGCVAYISRPDKATHARSAALANHILAQISAATGLYNRGCEWSSSSSYFDSYGNPLDYYAINRHCDNMGFPGIIIEHCFMDCDTSFIASDDWLVQFGIADAKGIAEYLHLPEK
ncbi:MAG: Ig-like domain-containing protein [Lachnospiraceae bacterium]|nr:Ig-like domain-containing protein [Lachnospiraceae bacterium]